jgi:hypothetical protein
MALEIPAWAAMERHDQCVADSGVVCKWASWELADEDDHVVLEVTGPPHKISSLARAFGL